MAASETVLYTRGEEGDESDAWDDTALIKAYDHAVSTMKAKLVQQYGDSSQTAEDVISKKPKKKKKGKAKPKKTLNSHEEWKIGDLCQAVYTEDGQIYAAEILSIDKESGTCTVQYLGYGNEEDQLLSSLMPPDSDAVSSLDQKSETASETENAPTSPKVSPSLPPPSNKRRNRRSDSHRQQPQGNVNGTFLPPPPPFGQMPPPPPTQGYQAPGLQGMPQAPIFPSVPSPPPWFTDKGASDENQALYGMLISWYMSGYHTGYYQGLKHASGSGSAASVHGPYR